MREKDKNLTIRCSEWAKGCLQSDSWLRANADFVGGENELLCREMRKASRSFRRLSNAASRKMCVGVFGPSQAGKSYLVSALACDREGKLTADFAGEAVDFLKKINPEGGKESTGLVTRFTTTPPAGVSKSHPIKLRLFSQMDLARVFANTYYADCDHKEAPNQEALLERLHELESAAGEGAPSNVVTADDMEELRDYLQKSFASRPRIQMLRESYWVKAMELAPGLSLENRVKLIGCIWDNVREFDDYFLKLCQALESLGNAPEAFCPLEALLPREKSIIDVAMLYQSAEGAEETISLQGLGGACAPLPRYVVTALTAEISIYMPSKPDAFFEYTDLLDFPGYRSREKVRNLVADLEHEPKLLGKLYLRGKVAYLFERYCREQELTSMLLCVGPSVQNVQDLPGAVDTWIALTQGGTPGERKGHPSTLFFILTQVDREFDTKAGVEDVSNRWETRLSSSLTDYFGLQYDWPDNWDGGPFKNLFLLRNPKYLCHALFNFSEEGRELSVREDMRGYVEQIHQAYLSSPSIKKYMDDPEERWNAAMSLNDGGISLLRAKIAPICDLDSKYKQTRARAVELAKKVAARLAPYYRGEDTAALFAQKKALAGRIINALFSIISKQRFADFLSRLQVSDYSLYEMATDCTRLAGSDGSYQSKVGTSAPTEKIKEDLFKTLGISGPGASEPQSKEEKNRIREEAQLQDDVGAFCKRAVDHWLEKMRAAVQSVAVKRMCDDPACLELLVNELIQSARNTRLLERMSEDIRISCSFRNIARDVLSWRLASEAAYRINSFVDWLGFDERLGEKSTVLLGGQERKLFATPELKFGECGEPIIPELPSDYDASYYKDWLSALYIRITENIANEDDTFDIEQNCILGEIIAQFKDAAPEG